MCLEERKKERERDWTVSLLMSIRFYSKNVKSFLEATWSWCLSRLFKAPRIFVLLCEMSRDANYTRVANQWLSCQQTGSKSLSVLNPCAKRYNGSRHLFPHYRSLAPPPLSGLQHHRCCTAQLRERSIRQHAVRFPCSDLENWKICDTSCSIRIMMSHAFQYSLANMILIWLFNYFYHGYSDSHFVLLKMTANKSGN